MKPTFQLFRTITISFALISMLSCEKSNSPELKSSALFSVDLDIQHFNYGAQKSYLAAYSPEGVLLGYGSLTDSSKWDLNAKYNGDKIDILFIVVWPDKLIEINHIKNATIGQTCSNQNNVAFANRLRVEQSNGIQGDELFRPREMLDQNFKSRSSKSIVFKVEDFGNRRDNTTGTCSYENWPYSHLRGYASPYGEFDWSLIENGFTYRKRLLDSDPTCQGIELSIFERGTNDPYIYYFDQPSANFNDGDTLTLHKSNFVKGKLNSIQVISSSNDFNNIFLRIFNSVSERRDLITSFDDVTPENGKTVRYFSSDNLPTSKWNFRYYSSSHYKTSYTINTNMPIPSTIEIKELTGQIMTKTGIQFEFTHSNKVVNSTLARSSVKFFKQEGNLLIYYTQHFEGSESIGKTTIKLFDIPTEILASYPGFQEFNTSHTWEETGYNQVYTNIDKNSPIDYLKNTLLNGYILNDTSSGEYTYENFGIGL